MRHLLAIATLSTALLAACSGMGPSAGTASGPAKVMSGVLVGGNGMTLYTFDKDEAGSGKSVCNGKCAENWPPLMAEAGAMASGDWSVIARDDGKSQWAYKGKPVYFWVKDAKPGDMTGEGFNGVWHTAKP